MTDRGDAEIAQDLGADADLAPLPVAVGFGGSLLRQRRNRNAGGAVPQVYQHAAAGLFEMFEHDLHALRPGESVPDDIRLVKARQHVLAVADAVIYARDVRSLSAPRAIRSPPHPPAGAFGCESRHPLS